ncbi:substrate-binding periplasmic protein, partial [Pseudomonas aeruginosa]
ACVMLPCWLALCGWLLVGVALDDGTIRDLDYTEYPRKAPADADQSPRLAPAPLQRVFGAAGDRVVGAERANWRRPLSDTALGL